MEIREATSPTPDDRDKPDSPCSLLRYIASPSHRAGSPTLTASTLDTGHTSADTNMTTERKLVMSGLPLVRRARSRAGSVACKTGGRIIYEDRLGHDEDEEYQYIYKDLRQPLVLCASSPTKQRERVVYQQVPPQYVYVYKGEGKEEYRDGELYYTLPRHKTPARRPALTPPKAVSFRTPNTNTDVTVTLNQATPPCIRYALPPTCLCRMFSVTIPLWVRKIPLDHPMILSHLLCRYWTCNWLSAQHISPLLSMDGPASLSSLMTPPASIVLPGVLSTETLPTGLIKTLRGSLRSYTIM